MKKDFHDKCFDEATQTKLKVFKRYIRNWIPVFMTDSLKTNWCQRINIYDLFSGPGSDADGTFGTPLIIQNELKAYCEAHSEIKKNIQVNLIFNDQEKRHIDSLKMQIDQNRCAQNCCCFSYYAKPFSEVVDELLPEMKQSDSANLILLDQFGIKEILPKTISYLLAASATDILFFISTSAIRRFAKQPEFEEKLTIPEIKEVEYNLIHRHLTEWFEKETKVKNTFFAPFSIKKGSNIYGLVFASKNMLGIEKFLDVCWNLDPLTGEANYNIDGEITWRGQMSLFESDKKVTKMVVFETELLEFINKQSPTNRAVYCFGLKHGFHSSKCKEALDTLQNSKKIKTIEIISGKKARKGAFYLKDNSDRIQFKGV